MLGDIYEDWGIRFASDVDMLVSLSNMWRLRDILQERGYRRVNERRWLGNRFKFIFRKQVGDEEYVIEVHTQLFWHTQMKWKDDAQSSSIPGFLKLSKEMQLVHLCGHLGFQHTFLKLFWLVDIHKFCEQYNKTIDWKKFWKIAVDHSLFKSCYMSLNMCSRLGLKIPQAFLYAPRKSKLSLWILKRTLDVQFLYDPRKHFIRYFIIKNLIKDSWVQSARYLYYWIRFKMNKI